MSGSIDVRSLRMFGGVLALIVALLHFLHPQLGFQRLILHFELGTLFDPRPLVFTLAAIAIAIGIIFVYNDFLVRPIYVLGILLMLIFIIGYGAWHTVLDHGGFWPHIPAHGHPDQGFIEIIGNHLQADRWALTSKVAELALLVVLVVLTAVDRE